MARALFGRDAVISTGYGGKSVVLVCMVAAGLFACTGPSAGGPSIRSPAGPVAAPAALPERGTPEVSLHHGEVRLDGNVLAQVPPGKLKKTGSLFDALLPRGMRRKGDGARTYKLIIGSQSDGGQMKSIVGTALAAGWPVATVGSDDSVLALHSEWYPSSDALEPWRDRELTIVVRNGTVELWLVSPAGSTADGRVPEGEAAGTPRLDNSLSGPSAPDPRGKPKTATAATAPTQTLDHAPPEVQARSQNLAILSVVNVPTELAGLLETTCSPTNLCNPAILFVANDASAAVIDYSLGAFARLIGKRGQSPVVQLRLDDPLPEGPPPNARPAKNAHGRLAPEVIQEAVRANFGAFRKCYEQGLGRDPKLNGKVVARFVIDLDGKVSTAGVTWENSMPDTKVTMCVLEQLKTIVFPPPEGGIVTVVYPIMFTPAS